MILAFVVAGYCAVAVLLGVRIGYHCGEHDQLDELHLVIVYSVFWPVGLAVFVAYHRGSKKRERSI